MLPKELIYLDLFSGTGGFGLGLKLAGYKFKEHFFSEIDKYAVGNYKYNFKNATHVGDIETIQAQKIKRPNLITFGSPCQDISVASGGEGLQGSKSKLFFRAIEIIKRLKPDCFIFENVRNLFSSNEGRDFETVLRSISEIGVYDCQWQLLNSSLVLPQNRERIYLVGHLAEKGTPKIFPLPIPSQKTQKFREPKKLEVVGNLHKSIQSGKVYTPSSKSPTITTDRSLFFLRTKDGARKFTSVELERIQGFPDDWTKYAIIGGQKQDLSDTQRNKLIGNAVSPALVAVVVKQLLSEQNLNGPGQPTKSTPMKNRKIELKVPEVSLKLHKKSVVNFEPIKNAETAANIFRSMYDQGEIELRESFFVLFLSRSNTPIGYYKHSTGGVESTVADIKLIMSSALKAASSSIIVAHNHPSGRNVPSESDKRITKMLKNASKFLDIQFLDSLIITKNNYFSFANEGLMGIESQYPLKVSNAVINELKSEQTKVKKSTVEKRKVDAFSDELKFIQRYVNINGRAKKRNHIRLFIKALQRSIRQRRIRKTSRFASEIKIIQKSLIDLFEKFENNSQSILVKLPQKRLKAYTEILKKIEELESIKLIQSYINIQGQYTQPAKVNNLLTRIKNAINSNKIKRTEKHYGTVQKIVSILEPIAAQKRIGKVFLPILSQNLAGFNQVPENQFNPAIPKNKVMNSMDIMELKFESLEFTGKWHKFIGDPSPGFTTMIYGRPKMGKSFLSIDFASYLAKNHGKVLYVAAEEQISAILQDKLRKQNAAHPNLDLIGSLPEDLSGYDFVFIDSVNHYNLSVEDLRNLKDQNPTISFVYVFQTTKTGLFRGSNEFQHDVDVVIEIPEKGTAIQYGRFNAGSEMKIFK
ncbi:MAG: hypothetical protein Crog4KO_06800 [Crocinitomicaceae bacterium]